MSHSVSPLGSLSSSPSPSPPPNPIDESELSELTDDDHDHDHDHDSKILNDSDPSHTDNDDELHPPPRSRKTSSSANSRRRQRRRLLTGKSLPASRSANPPSSSKRKKRGGLVPAPMWDWAYKNGGTGSPSSTPAPPSCLSPPVHATPLPGPSRPHDPDSGHGPHPPFNLRARSPTPDAEEEEEEELPTPPRAMEEEEGEEGDSRKSRPQDRKHLRHTLTSQLMRRKKIVDPMHIDYGNLIPRSKRGLKVMPRISYHKNNLMLKGIWESGGKLWDPNAPTSDEDEDSPAARRRQVGSDPSNSEEEMDVDDDVEDQVRTSPRQSPTRPTLDTHVKLTSPPSTSAVDQVADIPSLPPSIRASVDLTVSPPDEDSLPPATSLDDDVDRDRDADTPDYDDHPPAHNGGLEADGDEDEDAQPEDPSQPASPTPLAEPEPEPEPEDEDPDLQPAHRAEALDVLATIELKFALLREKVYVEKMKGLAWEETLVCDGTHPELHHIQNELAKRRDKRLMLASKKRTYEIGAVVRKKREEEVWCWEAWDIARTELQTEMIAEANRKRRKLERERRTIERPPGARRIPSAILNPPPAPTLRQIANTFPRPSHLDHLAANIKLSKGLSVYPGFDGLAGATSYPDLPTLSPHDIAADLEFLFQHRRMGYGFGMGFGPSMGVPIGVGVGYSGTSSGFGPPPIGFGGPASAAGFGVNGLGIGAAEGYPPNSGPGIAPANSTTQVGLTPLPFGGSGPELGPGIPASSTPSESQNIVAPRSIPGAGIASADGPSFSQPAMGVFQGPPSIGAGLAGYPLGPGGSGASIVIGPGGTTSTPVIGPGGGRIQRPSFVERELIQRDRELAPHREREIREREREFGPNMGPGHPAWSSKPTGGMDWSSGDARRREERERMERTERDRERERSQIQPVASTPSHRHLHLHPHSHPHTHQLQLPGQPHQPHTVHAHQSHSHQQSQHSQHHHPHGQHSQQHSQHGSAHLPPPHHHVGQHHHHRHHHHVVHHHHSSEPGSGPNSSGPDRASPLPQGSGSAVQTMEIINLSANPSSKSHWKRERDEAKLGGSSMPGSRPPSTHPFPPSHNFDERERERERDRPIATPFVLGPSHHTISSTASSPRHGWTPGSGEPGPVGLSGSFPLAPERFHSPVPRRFSNPVPNGLSQLPRPLTTSPPRVPPSASATSPSISAFNAPLPSSSTSTGPFRKPSPALPKLGMPPLGYSPRLAGPGIVPATGPGVPGVLSATSSGPGVTPSGILTSGPGVPPGPGIAPAPSVTGPPGEGNRPLSSLFSTNRTTSPLISYNGPPTQKVGIDGP